MKIGFTYHNYIIYLLSSEDQEIMVYCVGIPCFRGPVVGLGHIENSVLQLLQQRHHNYCHNINTFN